MQLIVHKYPKIVFAIVAAITTLALTQVSRIRTIISVYELLPTSFPSAEDLNKTNTNFNDGRYIIFEMRPKSGAPWTERSLCRIRHWVSQEAIQNTYLSKSLSLLDIRQAESGFGRLNYVRSLKLNCEHPTNKEVSLSVFRDSPWDGMLVSSDLKSLIVSFDFNESAVNTKLRAFSYDIFEKFKNKWMNEISIPLNLETHTLGSAPYESYLSKGNKDFGRVHFLLIILLLILFRIFMGTWRSGFLYLIGLVISLIWLLGLIGFFGGSLDILSNSLFVMIAVATIQDLSFLSLDRLENKRPAIKSFIRLQMPGFFTSLTTIVGFGSLMTSKLPMIHDFGLWAACGAFIEWLMTFFFLTLLTRPGCYFEKWTNFDKAFGFKWINNLKLHQRFGRVKYHFIVVLVFLLPWGLIFYDEPKLMFSMTHIFRQDTESFYKTFGWEYSTSLVFTDPTFDKLKLLDKVSKNSFVLKIEKPDAAFSWISRNLNPDMKAIASREFLKMARVDRYFGKAGQERAHVFLKTSEISDVIKLRDQIKILCGYNCYLSGAIVTYSEFVRSLSVTLFESLFISLLLISLIIYFLASAMGFSRLGIVMYSILWGPAALLILIMILRVPINMMTSLVGSVVLGLTGDNVIEFLFGRKTSRFEKGMDVRFHGALVTTIMMSIACLVFLASPFDPPKTLGVLFSLGFFLILFGDYYVLKYLWRQKSEKHSSLKNVE